MDLVHDAPLLGHVGGESGIVSGLVQRNIDVVPGRGFRQPATVLVSPGRCVGDALALVEQLCDSGLCFRVEFLLCNPGDDTMPQTSPCPDGRCGLKDDQQGKDDDEL